MQLDCLKRRDSMQRRQFVEVRAKLAAIANRNLHEAWFRETDVLHLSPFEILSQNRFQLFLPQSERVEFDEERVVRRMKVADAGNRFRLKQAEQFHDALVGFERDFFAEVNE